MTAPTRHCVICGAAGVRAPGLVCQTHLRTSERRLVDEQAGKPSAWVLAAGDEAAVRRLPPAEREVELPAGAVVLASFWQRFLAFLIDLPIAAIMALFFAAFASASPVAAATLGLGSWLGYFLLANSLGQMAGKAALDIKVIDRATGREPGFGKGALRTVGQALNLPLTLGFGFLMMLWDRHRMTIHDYMAGTIVVRMAGAPR